MTTKYESKSKVRLNTTELLRWRADNELTQKEAAEAAGVSLPTYRNAEYGKELQLVKASRIAKTVRPKSKRPLEELEEKSA